MTRALNCIIDNEGGVLQCIHCVNVDVSGRDLRAEIAVIWDLEWK